MQKNILATHVLIIIIVTIIAIIVIIIINFNFIRSMIFIANYYLNLLFMLTATIITLITTTSSNILCFILIMLTCLISQLSSCSAMADIF